LKPTTPQNAAGCRTEPPVSEPRAKRPAPEATAAAAPPLLPPAVSADDGAEDDDADDDDDADADDEGASAPVAAVAAASTATARPGEYGLTVAPKRLAAVADPIPNSSMFVLPSSTAPPSNARVTHSAVYGGTKPRSTFDAALVSTSRTQKLSFTLNGTPVSGVAAPAARRASAAAAWRSTSASSTDDTKQFRDARSTPRRRASAAVAACTAVT
jgi:hypothetical protein